MSIAFPDILFTATTALFADRMWTALLSDLPSSDPASNWLRGILFVASLALMTMPYLATTRWIAPNLRRWVIQRKSKRRPASYIV